MSIADRWHKTYPKDGEPRCREHKLVPTAEHGRGHRWQVRYRDSDGQRSRNFPKRNGKDPNVHAEAFDAKITEQLNTGTYINPNASKVTLTERALLWRDSQTCDKTTLEQITSRLKVHVIPKIGHREMGVLEQQPSLIQKWIRSLEDDGLSPLTIRVIVGHVSAICQMTIDDKIIRTNPVKAQSVKLPADRRSKRMPWSLARLDAMSEALPQRYRAMNDLGAGCALRQGELFGVAVDDLDFADRWVNVLRQVRLVGGELVYALPKGGKQRRVPMPDTTAERMSAHLANYPPVDVTLPWDLPGGELMTQRLVFVELDGTALNRNRFNRVWRNARVTAGIPNTRQHGMHVLRHTAASAWLQAGVDIRTVAEYLGHADPGFTLRTYIHLMPNSADRARAAMEQFFRGGEEAA